MILTCPRCATRYLVDADQLWTTGRTVQCDACGQRWRASGTGDRPPQPPAAPAAPEAPADAPVETHTAPFAEPPVESPATPAQAMPEPSTRELEDGPLPSFAPLEPPAAEPAPAPAPADAAAAEPALFLQTPKRSPYVGNGPPGLGRALAILFLVAMVAAVLVLFREAIVRAVPALAPIYSALGLSNLNLTGVGAHG